MRWWVCVLLLCGPARASIPELFGASPASMARASAGAALSDLGASSWEQPAALGLVGRDALRFHFQGGRFFFGEVQGVERIDGREGAIPQTGIAPWGFTVDAVKVLGPWVRAGAYASFPIPWLYFHETKDPWVPQVFRWQNRVARAVGTAAVTVRLPIRGVPGGSKSQEDVLQGGLWLGASMSILPRANIEIDLDLIGLPEDGAQPARIDVVLHDVDLAVRARFRPQVSLLLDLGTFDNKLSGLRLGGVWRGATQVDIDPIRLGVQVIDLGNLHFLFNAVRRIDAVVWLGLTDFYDPHQVQVSLAWDQPRFALAAELFWSDWSTLIPAYGRTVTGPDGDEGSLQIVLGDEPDDVYNYGVIGSRVIDASAVHDTVGFAVGGEIRPPAVAVRSVPLALTLRLGYRFEPGAIEPTAGPMTLMDGDRHAWGGGLRLAADLPGTVIRGPLGVEFGVMAERMAGSPLVKDSALLGTLAGMPVRYDDDASWSGAWSLAASLGVFVSFGP